MLLAEGPDQIKKMRPVSSIFDSWDFRQCSVSDTRTPFKYICKSSKLFLRILGYILTARESSFGLVFLVVPHLLRRKKRFYTPSCNWFVLSRHDVFCASACSQNELCLQIMDGNSDQNTRVDNHLNPAVSVRFIRFIPVESATDDLCMRVAVFKCRGQWLDLSYLCDTAIN